MKTMFLVEVIHFQILLVVQRGGNPSSDDNKSSTNNIAPSKKEFIIPENITLSSYTYEELDPLQYVEDKPMC